MISMFLSHYLRITGLTSYYILESFSWLNYFMHVNLSVCLRVIKSRASNKKIDWLIVFVRIPASKSNI